MVGGRQAAGGIVAPRGLGHSCRSGRRVSRAACEPPRNIPGVIQEPSMYIRNLFIALVNTWVLEAPAETIQYLNRGYIDI